jgi:epoxyqueuosine reductase
VSAPATDSPELAQSIKNWGLELGFQQVGITHTDLATAESRLNAWLAAGLHGELDYMEKHGSKRSRPAELWPGTRRVITARMDYLGADIAAATRCLADPERGYIARYALGRDYHKTLAPATAEAR